jgi:hypothetical protein
MLARVRTPSSWTNFSALPALFTGQRERLRERDNLFFKGMMGALAPFGYLVYYIYGVFLLQSLDKLKISGTKPGPSFQL